MNKARRMKLLKLTLSLGFAALFFTLYDSTAVHWEATGLSKSVESIPELTTEMTDEDLVQYPKVAAALNSVNGEEESFLSREDDDIILEFMALVDERDLESDYRFFVVMTNETYEIRRERYGSIEYEPMYLAFAALSLSPTRIILAKEGSKLVRGNKDLDNEKTVGPGPSAG